MDTRTEQERKVIGNVGVLDLRHATEAAIRAIRRIGNVGTVLYSDETARLLPLLTVGNVGATIQAPPDARFNSGQTEFTRHMFEGTGAPLNLIVTGRLFVYPDVRAEDLRRGLGQLVVSGEVIFPEHLGGAMRAKLVQVSGRVTTYLADESAQVIAGNFTLDEDRLRGLDDASRLLVVGNLRLPQVLPEELLAKKLAWLQVIGNVRCHEENVPFLVSRLADKSVKLSVVPTGYHLVEQDLRVDNVLLGSLPGRKLYCTGRVVLEADVEPAALDAHLDALVVEELLIAAARLRSTLANKINPLSTRAVFYDGELWLVTGEMRLAPARFEFLDGQATLVIVGEVTLDPAVEPRVLAARLAKVHNLGEINGTAGQLAAISARLGLDEGELVDAEKAGTGAEGVGNVGLLAL